MADLAAGITLDGGFLKFIWRNETAPVGRVPIHVNEDLLKKAAKGARARLGELTDFSVEISRAGIDLATNLAKKNECRSLLYELACAGQSIHKQLFTDMKGRDKEASSTRAKIDQEVAGSRLAIWTDCFCHVPWGVVYSKKAPLPLASADPTNPSDYAEFWGMKFRLAAVFKRGEIITDGHPLGNLKMLTVLNQSTFNDALSRLPSTRQERLTSRIGRLPHGSVSNSNDTKSIWPQTFNDHCLLFFYCHANGTRLELGPTDTINVLEFEELFDRPSAEESGKFCLTFLNGCSTAVGEGSEAFQAATMAPGFCGFIGTEERVPDAFALEFAEDLLEYIDEQQVPLIDAMYLMRSQYWPLSLLYGVYADPALRTGVAPTGTKSGVAPPTNVLTSSGHKSL